MSLVEGLSGLREPRRWSLMNETREWRAYAGVEVSKHKALLVNVSDRGGETVSSGDRTWYLSIATCQRVGRPSRLYDM